MKSLLIRFLSTAVIFVLSCSQFYAQDDTTGVKDDEPETPKRVLDIFGSDEPIEMSLEFDLKNFLNKKDRAVTFDGILTMIPGRNDTMDRKVTLKYRGFSRYQNCGYPPVMINFRKPVYFDSDTGKVKKIKLVHQCQRGDLYEGYIFREYLVYKLYNVLCDTSYRVRLLRIKYIDSKKVKKPFVLYGFFIEPKNILAARTNTLALNSQNLSQRDMIPEIIDRIAIFNYMVSNWDWSVPGQHNIDIFRSTTFGVSALGIPVPFDFDLTGVVQADYAIPPPELGIENNRERIFSGMCRSRDIFRKNLNMFLAKKQELYTVVDDFPYLSKASKKDITVFLDGFFGQLEKQKNFDMLVDLFMEKCKKL